MILPFTQRPMIQAYLHHAYTTGIMEAAGYRWALANEYLQLEVRLNDKYSGVSLFMDISPWTDLDAFARDGLCKMTLHSADSISNCSAVELAKRIQLKLDSGNYVEAYVDEYYIPETASFNCRHHNHALLILGHDLDVNVFSAIIYKKEGRFGFVRIPANVLCQAISMQPRLNAPYTADKAMREIAVSRGCQKALKIEKIKIGLAEFLKPDKGGQFDESILDENRNAKTGFVYGQHCYDYIETHIRRSCERLMPIDLRVTRLIWERAKVGGERLVLLSELFDVPRTLTQRWYVLIQGFLRVHLIAFQHNLDLKKKRLGRQSDALFVLSDVVREELELTEQLMSIIDK